MKCCNLTRRTWSRRAAPRKTTQGWRHFTRRVKPISFEPRQSKGYAQRKKPRNRRVEAFEVGGHCRIRKKGPTSRTRGGLLPWSTALWIVERITDHNVTVRSVESAGVKLDLCNDLAHIYGDDPLPCHHSGCFFSLIPLGHYIGFSD